LGPPSKATYAQWFEEVCQKTAEMIVHWQRVGFVHGVMNTDNMSILGLTIDYGPYGWLENFDPDWTPNTTDAEGRRYRYGNQPQMAYWNLVQLANAIYPLVQRADPLQKAVDSYNATFQQNWQSTQVAKLGLASYNVETDKALLTDLNQLLQNAEIDMTLFYRGLADFTPNSTPAEFYQFFSACSYIELNADNQTQAEVWFKAYQGRLEQDGRPQSERQSAMNRINPLYVLRNYLAQEAIDLAEEGDFSLVNELLEVLRNPYTEQANKVRFAAMRPEWAKHRAGCSMLSCSS